MMRARQGRLLGEALAEAGAFALNALDVELNDAQREAFLARLDNEFWCAVDERFIVDDEYAELEDED